jgi:predicted membrane protein (TIGR00267 family)
MVGDGAAMCSPPTHAFEIYDRLAAMSGSKEGTAKEYHQRIDPHHHTSKLSEWILGGQDGLVNVLGVVLGVAAATRELRVILAGGLAATFAESVSMAAVAFTSARAEQALYESEVARENRHVRAVPELERDEIREIYRKKGLSGDLLDKIVEAITSNREVWVAVMMAEELRLAPVTRASALRSAFRVGAAALIGSFIPLVPFLVAPVRAASWLAVATTGAVLFCVGAYKAVVTVGRWWWSGLEMAAIGIASAMIGYAVGALFNVG